MKVTHGKITIELEDNGERAHLQTAMCIVCEICNDAVRKEEVSGLLVRAGLTPNRPQEAGFLRDFCNGIIDSV